MILADTSVWIDHFRTGNKDLQIFLHQGQIVIHPWIVAELALGPLRNRARALAYLDMLPQVRVAQFDELRVMIEARRLFSLGIGLTDTQLLASAFLTPPTLLWTKDRKLRIVAEGFGIYASLP